MRPLVGVLCMVAVGAACAQPSTIDRAQALVRRHREAEAVEVLRERLRVDPADVDTRRLLVRVLALTGDLPAARVELSDLAQRLPPNDPAPFIELGHALELAHRYDEALAAYDDAARVAPDAPDGPREGGMRAARWGEVEAAGPRLEEAVHRGARDAEFWHALGLVRLHLGDVNGAEEAYRAGVAVDPKGVDSWLGLATVAMLREDAKGALEAYDQVAARRPRFGAAELGRAWALAKLGRRVEAGQALDRAAELGAPAANVARQRASLMSVPGGP